MSYIDFEIRAGVVIVAPPYLTKYTRYSIKKELKIQYVVFVAYALILEVYFSCTYNQFKLIHTNSDLSTKLSTHLYTL